MYGMEFSRQLSNLPAPWFLENMLLPLARKISPSLRVGTLEDPFFFSPIITASQVSRGQVVGGCFAQPVNLRVCLFLSSITQLSEKALSPIITASRGGGCSRSRISLCVTNTPPAASRWRVAALVWASSVLALRSESCCRGVGTSHL